jgi:hypothetical protein
MAIKRNADTLTAVWPPTDVLLIRIAWATSGEWQSMRLRQQPFFSSGPSYSFGLDCDLTELALGSHAFWKRTYGSPSAVTLLVSLRGAISHSNS